MQENGIVSVQTALDWENRNLHYAPRAEGGCVSTRETLETGRSNCRGFADLNYDLLCRLGYRPAIYSFQVGLGPEASRHAVVIFRKDGFFGGISNRMLLDSRESSLPAFFHWLGLGHDYHFPILRKAAPDTASSD